MDGMRMKANGKLGGKISMRQYLDRLGRKTLSFSK